MLVKLTYTPPEAPEPPPPSEPLPSVEVETFTQAWPIEGSRTHLKVLDYPRQAAGPERVRLCEIALPGSKAGDHLSCLASIQASNKLGYAIEFGASILATTDASGIQGHTIHREKGYNVTPQLDPNGNVWHGMHHGPIMMGGHYEIPYDGDWYILIVCYAGGSSYTSTPYDWMVLDPLGSFSVQRIRVL